MRYAYFGGVAAGAGAVALFLYGYVLAGAGAVLLAVALLWLFGIPLLLVPEVAHWRRVHRAIRDWNGLTRQVVAAAERRWEPLLRKLAELRPPPALAERHADALEVLRRRPSTEAGPAAAADFAVRARTTMRALLKDAEPEGGSYARDLRRLWTTNEAASDRDYGRLEVHCDGALRRIRRLKPPPSVAEDHARLIALSERYCAAMKQRTAAMASADGPGVQAATEKLKAMGGEYSQLLGPWAERERLRWYGPE
jgi:hypothetical protein